MARYYRRRYTRTIVRAPKKKWCSNMIPIRVNNTAINQGTEQQPVFTVALGTTVSENKSESTAPTPVVVKTGNFRLQVDVTATNFSSRTDLTLVVMYLPEGIGPSDARNIKDVMLKHPEWVIAWRKADLEVPAAGIPGSTGRIIMSSRLKRNLNSGDKVYVYMFATEGVAANTVLALDGICQFWSCAN